MATQTVIELFYDGECPLCFREIVILRRKDTRNEIAFVDILSPDVDFEKLGKSKEELMGQIHGRRPNGQWITGIDVFSELYDVIGFTFFRTMAEMPCLRPLFKGVYRSFAANRLRLTGRCESRAPKMTKAA
jgi:predicted DCC family thiol-disulfide oxidoreductase YuxK